MLNSENYDVFLPEWKAIQHGTSAFILFNQKHWFNSIKDTYKMISTILKEKPKLLSENLVENTIKWSADAQPVNWISKWADYSTTYGFGYRTNDNTVGVLFPDMTNLIQRPTSHPFKLHYINRSGVGQHLSFSGEHLTHMRAKLKILRQFEKFMGNNLESAEAENIAVLGNLSSAPIVHLYLWLHTTLGTVLHLSNGTIQINFVDHTKIILSSAEQKIMYFDKMSNLFCYSRETIIEKGWSRKLFKRILHVNELLRTMFKMFN